MQEKNKYKVLFLLATSCNKTFLAVSTTVKSFKHNIK